MLPGRRGRHVVKPLKIHFSNFPSEIFPGLGKEEREYGEYPSESSSGGG
jgi:hypothetical protein